MRTANYHSRTLIYNDRYRACLRYRSYEWVQWLDAHYATQVVDADYRPRQQKGYMRGHVNA